MKKFLTAIILIISTVIAATLPLTVSGATQNNPFTDVPDGKWFTTAVLYCNDKGYMSGTSDTTFSPGGAVTRAQMVLVMAKMADADLSRYTNSPFTDVPNGKWFTGGVVWAYENAITGGTGNGKFSPNTVVSREQLAVFLNSYAKYMGYDVSGTMDLTSAFNDAGTASGWAMSGLGWAVDSGLISGTGEATLSPKLSCTRAQLAVIIMKFDQFYTSGCRHEWTKASCTEGIRCTICGYARGTALGHDANPTCTKSDVCKRCGETVPALGHDPKQNCTTPVTCKRCGQYFPALNHVHTELINVVEPTPTSEGYSGDYRCIDCGKIVKKGQKTPKTIVHSYPEVEREILRLCNAARAEIGVAPLTWSETIYKCADLLAKECEIKFSHTRPDGTECFTVFSEILGDSFSFLKVGENLAYYYGYGEPDAQRLFDMWMKSESHKKNILDPEFTQISIGIYHTTVGNTKYVYASQLFYTPLN